MLLSESGERVQCLNTKKLFHVPSVHLLYKVPRYIPSVHTFGTYLRYIYIFIYIYLYRRYIHVTCSVCLPQIVLLPCSHTYIHVFMYVIISCTFGTPFVQGTKVHTFGTYLPPTYNILFIYIVVKMGYMYCILILILRVHVQLIPVPPWLSSTQDNFSL